MIIVTDYAKKRKGKITDYQNILIFHPKKFYSFQIGL